MLERFHGKVIEYPAMLDVLKKDKGVDAVICTGNYLSDWVTDELVRAVGERALIVLDTRISALSEHATVFLPTAMWAEKAGTFENVNNRLQAFDRAIDPLDYVKSEAQVALDLEALRAGETPAVFNPALIRQAMAAEHGLTAFTTELHLPGPDEKPVPDMEMVEL